MQYLVFLAGLTIKDSRIEGGELQLHQGQANYWRVDGQEHQLAGC